MSRRSVGLRRRCRIGRPSLETMMACVSTSFWVGYGPSACRNRLSARNAGCRRQRHGGGSQRRYARRREDPYRRAARPNRARRLVALRDAGLTVPAILANCAEEDEHFRVMPYGPGALLKSLDPLAAVSRWRDLGALLRQRAPRAATACASHGQSDLLPALQREVESLS
jgi:Phosphotransferase enzyme family